MQKHTKAYMDSMGFKPGDFIPCEECTAKAVDVHHITPKSVLGSDEPENLIALCRTGKACHGRAEDGKLSRKYLYRKVRKRMGSKFRAGKEKKGE